LFVILNEEAQQNARPSRRIWGSLTTDNQPLTTVYRFLRAQPRFTQLPGEAKLLSIVALPNRQKHQRLFEGVIRIQIDLLNELPRIPQESIIWRTYAGIAAISFSVSSFMVEKSAELYPITSCTTGSNLSDVICRACENLLLSGFRQRQAAS
jgi:hypothetical protein